MVSEVDGSIIPPSSLWKDASTVVQQSLDDPASSQIITLEPTSMTEGLSCVPFGKLPRRKTPESAAFTSLTSGASAVDDIARMMSIVAGTKRLTVRCSLDETRKSG